MLEEFFSRIIFGLFSFSVELRQELRQGKSILGAHVDTTMSPPRSRCRTFLALQKAPYPPQVASVLSFVIRFILLSGTLCEWNPTECAFGSGVLSQLSLCETHRCCVCNIILFPHCVAINFFYFHKISKEGEIVLEGKRQMHVLWGHKPFVFSSKTPLPLHFHE